MRRGQALPANRWDLLDGVLPDEPPSVSVIVAHYRQPEQLARTLHALRRQDHPSERLEVIVVDDGSPEVPVVPDGVILVRQPDEGFRLAAARNRGARRASGDILVFLDADTAPAPGFVRELTRLPALAPDVVSVGRRRHADLDGVDPGIPLDSAVRGRELAEPEWLADAYGRSHDLLHADDRSYRFVIGAVLSCSREFFADVGGFDESFTTYGGEDWEWAYRAWLRGAVFAHVPVAVAWHDGPDAGARPQATRATKTAETLRLADLIPLPGSRGHGVPPAHVDVAVHPPTQATPGQTFVALDSALATLPGAAIAEAADTDDPRFDRVRVRVRLQRPVRVSGDTLAVAAADVGSGDLGEIVLTDHADVELVRVSATRALARGARWARDDLFRTERRIALDIVPSVDEPNLEAYLGGWG